MNRQDDPDGFNQEQMRWAYENAEPGQEWVDAQNVAWGDIADRLAAEQIYDGVAMVLAWMDGEKERIRKARAGVRRARKEKA